MDSSAGNREVLILGYGINYHGTDGLDFTKVSDIMKRTMSAIEVYRIGENTVEIIFDYDRNRSIKDTFIYGSVHPWVRIDRFTELQIQNITDTCVRFEVRENKI